MNKQKITINFIVEGQTEEYYLKYFKNEHLSDEFVFKIKNVKNGNYTSFISILEQYRGTSIPVFIVADLDRAANDNAELKHLKKLCAKLSHINKYSNIFLTYKNFETFLSAHFTNSANMCRVLCIDSCDIKNNRNIYLSIKSKGGSYENAIKNLNEANICYCKRNFVFPKHLDANKLATKQSSLIILKEYCEFLKNNR
nr:RloB domain-containing protein [uncultured Campylobacter sp.]